MIQLHGNELSGSTQPVLWYLDELSLPFELTKVGKPFGGNDTPSYLRLNPNGLVPTLVDGDHVLWESTAILRYLAVVHGNRHMFPGEPGQSLCDQWMTWHVSTLVPVMRSWYIEVFRNKSQNREIVELETQRANRLWGIVDHHLASTRFLVGDEITLADLCVVVPAHRWFALSAGAGPHVNLRAWYDRMRQREQFAKCLDVPFR